MRPEGWQQLDQLFHAALEREPDERAAFLHSACAGDQSLHKQVEELLIAHAEAGSFIEHAALEVEARSVAKQETELAAGQSIGHYRIISQLGAGGMGEVYLAADTTLGRKVALKLLPVETSHNLDRVRRFQQEAHAASALNHPNIITIHEIAHIDNRYLMATEFIEGETLRERICGIRSDTAEDGSDKSGTGLALREVLNIAIQTAEALAAAHEAGIVHRDIKPENIMVRRRDGYIKVLDFGLAKLSEPPAVAGGHNVDTEAVTRAQVKTSAGIVMGTVSYMSPEQTRGENVDARTDLWSLGAVLYELVAGRAPFDRPTPSEIIAAILEHDPPPLDGEIPSELEGVIRKALTKDREHRYKTAKDLLNDLRPLQRDIETGEQLEFSMASEPDEPSATGGTHKALTTAISTENRPLWVVGRRTLGIGVLTAAIAVLVVAAIIYRSYSPTRANAIDSIAVLPLENTSGDKDTEYLSDGISESLINSLSHLPQLTVKPRTLSFLYKGQRIDPRQVGRDLGVGAILTGRLVKRDDKLDIQIEIVETSKASQVWGRQYERQFSASAITKQEIASDVAEWLRPGLDRDDLKRGDTVDSEAYDHYLRGRQFQIKGTEDGWKKAISEYQQATAKDGNYALAWAALSQSYALFELNISVPSSETMPNARAAVEHALRLDDSLAETHTSLAIIEWFSWNFSAAEREFKRAIELNANSPTAHHFYGWYLGWVLGRFDEAMAELRRARQLDPLSAPYATRVAQVHNAKGELEEAIKALQRVLDLNPDYVDAHRTLATAYRKQGRYEAAIVEFEKAVNLSGGGNRFLADLGVCYALAGNIERARAVLKKLKEQYDRREGLGRHIASVYAALGEKDQAFAWLEKDFQSHSGSLSIIAHGPASDILRATLSRDPRWNDLLRRIGLPQG